MGYSSALFYMLVYLMMSLAAFGLIVLMSQKGQEIQSIDDFKGLNQRNPWLAFSMMIVMFSMAGIPPTAGFFAKILVLKSLVDNQLLWLAVLGLLFAVVGAYYYLRIVKVMYFDSPTSMVKIKCNKSVLLLFNLNVLAILFLGLFPSVLIQACINAFSQG